MCRRRDSNPRAAGLRRSSRRERHPPAHPRPLPPCWVTSRCAASPTKTISVAHPGFLDDLLDRRVVRCPRGRQERPLEDARHRRGEVAVELDQLARIALDRIDGVLGVDVCVAVDLVAAERKHEERLPPRPAPSNPRSPGRFPSARKRQLACPTNLASAPPNAAERTHECTPSAFHYEVVDVGRAVGEGGSDAGFVVMECSNRCAERTAIPSRRSSWRAPWLIATHGQSRPTQRPSTSSSTRPR